MVTTRQKATSNRRVTRRSRSTVVYNKRKRKKLSFQDYDNKLTSLRKKQRIGGVSKAAGLTNQATSSMMKLILQDLLKIKHDLYEKLQELLWQV